MGESLYGLWSYGYYLFYAKGLKDATWSWKFEAMACETEKHGFYARFYSYYLMRQKKFVLCFFGTNGQIHHRKEPVGWPILISSNIDTFWRLWVWVIVVTFVQSLCSIASKMVWTIFQYHVRFWSHLHVCSIRFMSGEKLSMSCLLLFILDRYKCIIWMTHIPREP